eukprot:1921401-Amphidinium_carterae.1
MSPMPTTLWQYWAMPCSVNLGKMTPKDVPPIAREESNCECPAHQRLLHKDSASIHASGLEKGTKNLGESRASSWKHHNMVGRCGCCYNVKIV